MATDPTVTHIMEQDQLARHLGFEVLDTGLGTAAVRVRIRSFHRNAFGMVHGGTLFALADFAFALACNSRGVPAVAVNVAITYLRPAKGDVLIAQVEEVSCSRSLGHYRVTVSDGEERQVAIFNGTAFRKVD
jgi:acyl-CoA thioesterase